MPGGGQPGRKPGPDLIAALRRVFMEDPKGVSPEDFARAIVKLAKKGHNTALKTVFDRIHGAVVQPIELSQNGDLKIIMDSRPAQVAERKLDAKPPAASSNF